jgi:hypothetical protein
MTLVVLAGFTLAACTGTSIQLQSAELETDPSGETEMEFTGLVDSIGPDAWSVGGLTVGITVATEIAGEPQVGDLVKVHALIVPPETLVAREITLAEPDRRAVLHRRPARPGDEIEFVGRSSPSPPMRGPSTITSWPSPRIPRSRDDQRGDLVKVHALVGPDLSLTASEIEPASQEDALGDDDAQEDDEEDLEFKGIVEAINGEDWTVSGVHFLVPATLQFEGAIAVGDFVEIHAAWSSDGVLTAIRVQLEDESGDGSAPTTIRTTTMTTIATMTATTTATTATTTTPVLAVAMTTAGATD